MGYIRRSYMVRPPTRAIPTTVETLPSEPAVEPAVESVPEPVLLPNPEPIPEPAVVLSNQFSSDDLAEQQRNLWNDMVWRQRNFYFCFLYSLDDLPVAKSFLDQNIRDTGASIKLYYGNGAGDRLRDALDGCLSAFVNVLDYVKTAPVGLDLATDPNLGQRLLLWRDRYDALFEVFASLNSAVWNKTEMRNLVANGRDFWWNQLQARHNAEWVRDLTFLDYSFSNAAEMAEMVIKGLPR